MSKQNKQTPGQAHAQHCTDVEALLNMIQQEVIHHAEYARGQGLDWGRVDEIAPVRQSLIKTLASLACQDEDDIEDHLVELRHG